MDTAELLAVVCDKLDALGIRYLITGSMATIAYGEPRFTRDIDIVIDLAPSQTQAFCETFPEPEFYVSLPAVADAVRQQRQFNVIHPASGLKIDFMLLTQSQFDQSRRARGRMLDLPSDRSACFASPEDVILKKLLYYQLGGSDRHLSDIRGVVRVQGAALDRGYIVAWAERLGVAETWRAVADDVDST